MDPAHPYLKRPSVEIPAVRVELPTTAAHGAGASSFDWGFVGVLGTGLGVIAILLVAGFSSHSLPPIPSAAPLAVSMPHTGFVVPDMAPVADELREQTQRIGDMVVFAPPARRAALASTAPAPATVTAATAASVAAPVPAPARPVTAFADQVVLYRPAEAATPNAAPEAAKPANAYHVVSLASAEIALIGMDIAGQVMVSPFRVGQSLPDGRTITAIDLAGHRVVTSNGALGAP